MTSFKCRNSYRDLTWIPLHPARARVRIWREVRVCCLPLTAGLAAATFVSALPRTRLNGEDILNSYRMWPNTISHIEYYFMNIFVIYPLLLWLFFSVLCGQKLCDKSGSGSEGWWLLASCGLCLVWRWQPIKRILCWSVLYISRVCTVLKTVNAC